MALCCGNTWLEDSQYGVFVLSFESSEQSPHSHDVIAYIGHFHSRDDYDDPVGGHASFLQQHGDQLNVHSQASSRENNKSSSANLLLQPSSPTKLVVDIYLCRIAL